MTNILLREAESLIMATRLLDEERPASQSPRVWTTTAKSQRKNQGKGVSPPQLAQDWVDALDKTSDAGAVWRKLATLPTQIWPCVKSFL